MTTKKQTIKLGIFGLGTVGTGLVELLHTNAPVLHNANINFEITQIVVHNLSKQRAPITHGLPISIDSTTILTNPAIQIVVEAMGTIEPAKTYISAALNAGKHVVTANKDLLAKHGPELIALAQQNKVNLYYEASVAGGIPILQTLTNSYASDQVTQIVGVLNGTANYILSQMGTNHLSYAAALQQAQKLGFAESNPAQDVEGIDSAYKLSILARLVFGTAVQISEFPIKGITAVTATDLQLANELGFKIKLLAISRYTQNGLALTVAPTLVAQGTLLANVDNENNGINITSAALGNSFLAGKGAGALPTAQSLTNDLLQIARNINTTSPELPINTPNNVPLIPVTPVQRYFIRTIAPLKDANAVQRLTADRRGVITTPLSVAQLDALAQTNEIIVQYPILE
ncbi:homoserine dehydrogenase [Periweissella cryptocerci]|uniref:Homoserine dehydrogenase n=1 Tax=Periweissella cryptocerci TaxID=2506420 RepID=A0A4P6YT40_9LACO|nr:homoserine dehydrogenase [Periweissella cryptocerci]QBO35803.1 homoserine dehydrogenase [Periweissella cryptocerci]